METAFRVLAEHAPELVAQQRSDGVIEYVSRACRALLGYEPAQLVGLAALELVYPDDVDQVLDHHRRVRDRGETASYTARLRHRDGGYVALDFTLYPLREEGIPPPYGYVSVVRDASYRLREEQEKHANGLRLRALLNAVPGMIYQLITGGPDSDRPLRFTFVNDWPKNALGLDLELSTFFERLTDITLPEDAQAAADNLREALRENKPWSWHGRLMPSPGVLLHVVGHSMPEPQPDGTVLWSGVMLDDTLRMRMQEALFQSEEQCRTVVAHMDMAHLRFDLEGNLQSVNSASVRLLGYEREAELLEQSVSNHLWLSPVRYGEVLQRVLADGLTSVEMPLRCRDGSLRTVQGALRLLRDVHGAPVAIDGVLRDITEELRARAELVQAREMAEAGSRAKSAFLANMSHEIRTPMNAIIGLSHLALEASPPPKHHEYLTQIHAAGVALLGILNDILDVSKIEAGKLALEAEPFDIEGVLSALSRVVTMRAAEKELELVFAIDPRVPDELVGDRMRLGQVLTNLASNAIKFTDAGEVLVSIDVIDAPAAVNAEVRLRFSVRDSGIGLTQEQQERLFMPFSQVDESTTRRHGGTGLGLAISQELVHIMGGHIEVRSRPGQGSEFFFDVGFGIGAARARPKLPGEPRVLVVDDCQGVRDAVTRTLLAFGCAVAAVPSGAAALVALQQAEHRGAPYQIALIDVRMPGMDGLTLAARIDESMAPTRRPVLLMMAVESHDELFGALELGPVRALLRKPLGRTALHDAVASATRRDKGSLRPTGVPKEREHPLTGLRLLVVEDNEINQILARDLLEAAGAHVVIASDGREAIDIATSVERPFDVILMDVQMPGMDGHATTRVLRSERRTRATPIVAMTAHAFDAERKKCLESGMNAHVAKPINPPELLRTVLAWAHKTLEAPKTPVPPAASDRQPADPERFDPTALRSVFRDPARQLSFLRKFVDSARLTLSGLEPAWHARSSEAIGFAGHKLKSSAKACGAHALANVCAALELHAKDDNWAELEPLRAEAEQLLDEVRIVVEDLERRTK